MAKATTIDIDVRVNLKVGVWTAFKARLLGIHKFIRNRPLSELISLAGECEQIEVTPERFPTCELVEELVKREGVAEIDIKPHQNYHIMNADDDTPFFTDTGPARILVVVD